MNKESRSPKVFDATKIGDTRITYLEPKKLDPNGEVKFLVHIYKELSNAAIYRILFKYGCLATYKEILKSIRSRIVEIQKLITPPQYIEETVKKLLGENEDD